MQKNSIFSWWVANPIAANLAMLMLIVSGLLSYTYFVEKEPFPTVQYPQMEVYIRWYGASPRNIEDQILVRIEDAVKNVAGIKEIRSVAWEGGGRVKIEGKERVDRQKFADGIRESILGINGLPSDADSLIVKEKSNRQAMIQLAVHGQIDEIMISRIAREIRQELASLPLISAVETQGERSERITIEIAEDILRLYSISFDEVNRAIQNSSVNISTGVIRGESGAVQLSVRSRAEDKSSFDDIILRRSDDGAVLRLGDVADVITGLPDSWRVSAFDGESAVILNVMSGDYMNIPRMSESVRNYVAAKQVNLPNNVSLTLWSDWNDAYQARLSMLFWNALSGLGLVVILLMFFLQLSVALWVAAGIGTAFAAAFMLMPVLDVSLTMLSLFAFLMVIGIVVDDAIVVGESIHRANERGFHDERAAVVGVTEVAKPVIFGVLTTMIVFAPMAFLPGTTSEFTRSISIVVCLALAFSLFESLCILPSHLRHLPHPSDSQKGASTFARVQQKISLSFEVTVKRYYLPLISWCLTHRLSVIATNIGMLALAFSLLKFGYVKESFFPEIVDDKIGISIIMPETTSRDRSLQVMQQVNQGIQDLIDYSLTLNTGEKKAGLVEHYYSELKGTTLNSSIKLVDHNERVMGITQVADKLREFIHDVPDAEDIEFSSTLNTVEARLGFKISSDSLEALAPAVKELKAHIQTYEGVYLVRDNMDKGGAEFVFELKPGAQALGVNIREVSKQLRQAYIGQEVQRLPSDGGESRIYVRYTQAERESIETLDSMRIRTNDGREIPLMSVVDFSIQTAVQRVERRDGKKIANIKAEYSGSNANKVKQKIKKEFVPSWRSRHPEVRWGLGRQSEEKEEFMHTVLRYEGLAFLVAYMLMAIAFRSYVQPLLLMSAIPFAYMGAIFGHFIHGVEYGMFSLLGFLAAAGVVINDNLVLLDGVNRLRGKGLDAIAAVKEAGCLRFRAIILTSLTTFVGLLPMLSAQSVQAKFLVPMVVSLAYGVLAATFVTLILVPCLYVMSSHLAAQVKKLYSDDKLSHREPSS